MSEARQRWRVVYARGEEARFLSHLDAAKLWERAFRRGSLPVAMSEGLHPRPRVIFASPLPLGMLAERELVDLYLAERLTRPELRSRLLASLPRGFEPVDLYDVWLGAPALATQLVAADYRMAVLGATEAELAAAAAALLAAPSLEREKRREAKAVAYDLRPLLIDLRVGGWLMDQLETTVSVRMRLRHSQDQGSGRAEEVVTALGEQVESERASEPGGQAEAASSARPGTGREAARAGDSADSADAGERGRSSVSRLEMVRPIRERLWLAEEMPVERGFDAGVDPGVESEIYPGVESEIDPGRE